MTTQIRIEVIHGNRSVHEDDIDRAETAALQYLADHGETPESAHAEFKRQWTALEDSCQDYSYLTGAARIWVDAQSAADVALTDGWRDPGGASCCIGL